MDSVDLIARENEFKKLNKQLEMKTEKLMKEIEHVMEKQDPFSEFSHRTLSQQNSIKIHSCESKTSTPEKTPTKIRTEKSKSPKSQQDLKESECVKRIACDCCSMKSNRDGDMEFLYAFVSVNIQDEVLPKSFLKDNISVESVCKFLSSKVKLMQEQILKLQSATQKKASQCELHLKQLAELESERMSLINRSNNMKSQTGGLKAKCNVLQNKLIEKDSLCKEQRSEIDRLTNELKNYKNKHKSFEARAALQDELIATLRQQLQAAKIAEKEFRDSTRSLSASNNNAILRLEERVKFLTARIDKQTSLIDNLRQQNSILSMEGASKALERDFFKFLSQDL